ncbi:ankyrin-3 isoform X6 [Osmerus eperlanus]|uniref:ankyrin-3 isoform X6 n=1 Tax=Osmerus eperlanus TaxID=29151 RepID=UPI002E11ED94
MNVVLTDSTLSLFLVFLFLFRYFTFKFMLNLLIQETTDRSSPRTQPTGYAYKPVFSTRSYQAWSAVPVAVPGQARSGFGSPTSSSSNTPSASPLKSVWSITSASPIKSNLGGSPAKSVSDIASPIRSYRTISSPIKTVVQQAQYPVQVNPTLLYSPGKSAPDPVSVKGLAALSARTSPITTGGGAALLERSSIAMTPPASPKSSLNMYNSTLPYKAVIVGSGAASNSSSSPIKTVPGLSSVRSGAEPSSPSRGLFSSLSSPIKSNPPPSAAALINGTVSPTKYRSSSPTSLLPSSLQERIQATTNAATTSVNAAFEEVEKTFNSCSAGYGTLKSLSSSASSSYQSMRSSASSSLYASLRSPPNSTTTVTSSTMTVPVYSVMNVLPEPQFKKLPEVSKSAAALLSPRKTALPEANVQAQSSFARTLSPVKSPLFMSPAALKSTTSSPLSSSQEILKDVAEMKEDLIRMSAILQTETNSASKGFQSDSPKEAKIEDEEPFRIVEKVKQDLVKVSEILTKDTVKDGKAALTKSALEEAQFSRVPADPPASNWSYPPRYETVVPQIKAKTLPDREFSLGKDLKLRSEEGRRDGEEKQKRVLKPAVAVQEHKLKMPPINMRSSASEKELCKLADVLFGPDVVLDSPDDILHDQDKSPLSDSGFETRSERTPSAPQSAEGMGPKALFQDIPPVITETRTEVVHVIRSYESPEDNKQPGIEDSRAVRYIDSEPKGHLNLNASTPDQNKCFQIKVSPEEDNMGKGMRVKEETHITTTTRMVYHKPPSKEAMSERCEETMSVHDIMKAFQSGRDPSRELAGLFEHKGGNEESSQRVLEDMNSKPKVERIIEVHIEKGNKTEPTEVIIRETSNHPEKEMYIYQGNGGGMRELTHRGDLDCSPRHEHEEPEESLPCYLESSRVHTPMSQEEDSRPSSAQLMADDSYKTLRLLSQQSVEYNDDESSELRGESYNFAEKMLLSEQLESSHSDTEEYLRDRSRFHSPDRSSHSECRSGGPRTEYVLRSSKNVSDKSGRMSNSDDNYDKLTLLQYSSEPGSPKQSVWMRVTDDRQAKNREKIIYEDRVDRTVKEAEEKLSEVSQFFRDKTEKLNDELSSPEKKSRRPDFRETRSGPSSTHSSPERSTYRNSGEDWSRDRFRDRFGTNDRKCASLPSSPERRVLLQYDDSDKSKQGDSTSQGSTGEAPKPFQMSSSKVSAVRLKFEQEAQKQDINPKWGQNSNPPVRKLQESKLPVYQVFAGSNLPQTPDSPGIQRRGLDSDSRGQTPSGNRYMSSSPKHTTNGKEQEEINILKTWESQGNGNYKSQPTKLSHILVPDTVKEGNGAESLREQCFKEGMSSKEETTQKIIYTELVVRESPSSSDGRNVSLKKNSESQIPVRIPSGFLENHQSTSLKLDPSVKLGDRAGSHIPTLARNRLHSGSEAIKSTNVSSIGKSADSLSSVVCNGVDSDQVEYLDQVTPVVVTEGFKDIKPLPVYVSIQVGKQYEKETATGQLGTYKKIVSHESRTVHETRGGFHSVKQQPASPHGSPEDDTLEQVTFMDSSGKSPVTPETPSSEEVSLASRTPDSVIGFMPGMPSPIPEESEEEDGKTFIYKESPQEKAKPVSSEPPNKKQEAGQRTKEKRVAYIEFPPPPPLEAEHSDPEKRGSCASSEAETEMMEVNLQEEHDRHLLAEPIIRVQPPSPVPPGADDSDSSDDESVFHPIPTKKYTFKMKEEGEKRLKAKKSEKNVTQKESAVNGVVKGEDVDFEQNGNDQSITDCSIATTAEFSHDTDATEIDSLDGYDLQDEDDGMSEQDPKSSSLSMDGKNTDRSFNQSKLEVIEEEKTPCEEGGGENAKSKSSENNENEERDYTLEGRHPERLTQTENYFGYQLEEELNSTFKTVATKGLDFDPWSTKGSEDGVYEAKAKDEDPKPFGLSVEDKSQATTPDTTPARTPTDESTPTSEPNPFPFHEGKMFEMTRSGAIDMSKRDFVEERLQFFQIGPQSPCERTDLRMAIVADHLGLSWTELAREMNFSVDEINHIRVENPNSLTAQSFMLLKKWVSRDGKNATTDALTAVLTKVNRMDIVTLLEGPIFDYDYHSILAELQSPVTLGSESTFMELHPDLPTPTPTPSPTIHHTPDEFLPDSAPLDLTKHQPWDDEMGLSVDLESPPRSPPRPCELALSFPVFDPTALSDAAMDVEGQVPLQHAEKITKVEVKLNHCQKSFPSTEEIEAEEEIALPTMPSLSPPSCEQGQEQETRTTESGNGGEKGELDREVGVSGGGEREKDREENSVREMEEVTEKDSGDAVEGGMLEGEEGCTVAPEVHKIEEVLDIVSEKWDMMEDSGEAKQDEQMGTSEGEKELEECAEKIEKRNSGLQEAEGLQERDRIAEDGGEAKLSLQSSGEDGGEAKLSLQSSGEDGGEAKLSLQSWAEAVEEDRESGSSEEEEDRDEMTEDKIKSLLEDVKLEGAEEEEEGEEMTEARVQEILRQVQQAEKQLCSNVPGWNSESSSVNVEPPTPGRSVSSDLLDRQENSQENSSDSVTSSSRAESGRTRHNGNHSEPSSQDTSLPAPQDSANGRAGLGKEEGTLVSENKVQQRVNLESGSDEEQIITTRVFRRRVILKGEQAMHVPGESMTEEQYTDDDGNLITRKVIRKVIRRAATPTPEDQGGEWGRRGHGEPWAAPSFQEEESEPGEGARSSRRKEDRRSGEKTLHS